MRWDEGASFIPPKVRESAGKRLILKFRIFVGDPIGRRMEDRDSRERSAIRRRLKKLRRTYVLAIFNRRTFEEKASVELTPLRFLWIAGGAFFLVVLVLFSLVAFTPIKRYLPGYPGKEMEERSIRAIAKADSLEQELELMKTHFQKIRSVFDGVDSSLGTNTLPMTPEKLSKAGKERKAPKDRAFSEHFFPPLRGALTDAFDEHGHHFGVDLTASKGASIKATLEGRVVFSSWTPDQGNVIQIQHPNGMLSVYMHNSILLKETGQKVRAGEPIAIIGNSGRLTTGPHLHFELWHKGEPIDPEEVMVF